MRANHVPALIMAGFWIGKKTAFISNVEWHVKAAFFAEGIGWIPVDASVASLWNVDGFGVEGGDFLATHVDPEVEFPSPYWGNIKLDWLQGIYLPTVGGTWDGPQWRTTLAVTAKQLNFIRGHKPPN